MTDTSSAAHASIAPSAQDLRNKVLATLRAHEDGLTVHETAALMREPVPSVQPRFSELRGLALIFDGGARRKNDSGRKAIVWRA